MTRDDFVSVAEFGSIRFDVLFTVVYSVFVYIILLILFIYACCNWILVHDSRLFRYYEGLQKCVGLYLEDGQYSPDQIDQLDSLYKAIVQQYKWSSAVKVILCIIIADVFTCYLTSTIMYYSYHLANISAMLYIYVCVSLYHNELWYIHYILSLEMGLAIQILLHCYLIYYEMGFSNFLALW